MKKTALLLTLVLIVGLLSACGSATNSSSSEPTSAPTDSQPTSTPTTAPPTDTPTPTPSPTPDPNCFFKCDFDSAPEGLLLKDTDAETLETITTDYSFTYLLFSQIGAAFADLGKGIGVDGTDCLVATGRNGTWNGIAIDLDNKWYGKGFYISFDGKCESMKDGVTDMLVSLTTQFQYVKEDGTNSGTMYPAYNRVTGTSTNGSWVHCEGTVFIPSDLVDGTARIYFECADGKGKEDILIDNLEIKVVDGVGTYQEFEAYWAEHAPVEEAE